ncbi:MAG: ECF transporter S component, partial [Lutispora sp.]|nr:ECF transporter S component [Lutispora sp.]
AFFDLLMGFSPYTLWSFFIKGLAGFIVGSIAHSGGAKGKSFVRNILAVVAGAAWALIGYLGAWTAVIGKFEAALLNIPISLITSAVGALVALPLAVALYKPISKLNIGE